MAGVPTLLESGASYESPSDGAPLQYEDVEQFIQDFNRYVFGDEYESVTTGAEASPGGVTRFVLVLTPQQRERAREAMRANYMAGILEGRSNPPISDDGSQENMRALLSSAQVNLDENKTKRANAAVFLEILDTLNATDVASAPWYGTAVNRNRTQRLGNFGTPPSFGPGEIRGAIETVQEEIIEELQEDVESRTQEQEDAVTAILARQQGILSVLMLRILKSGLVDLFYDTIYQIDAPDASDFVSRFTNTELLKDWFESPSSLLSSLIPKVRIFKEFTAGDDFAERGGKVIEFKFDNFVRAQDVEDIATGRGRGGGAGIQSFSWDFEGQNVFEITRNIKANLKIFVQDLSKLFPTDVLNITNTQVSKISGNGPQEAYIFELFRHVRQIDSDLTEPANAEEINPYEYRLKVEVGWFFDQTTLDNLGLDANAKRLMNQISRVLDLTLEQHQINFNQDGTISIDLTYRSFMDGLLRDPTYYNILSMGPQSPWRTERALGRYGIDVVRRLSGTDPAPATTEEALLCGNPIRSGIFEGVRDNGDGNVTFASLNQEEFARALAGDINNPSNIINNYNAIFNRLIGGSRIYVLGFNYGLIADKVSSGIENSAQEAVNGMIDAAGADAGAIFIGSESTEDAFLRVVTNELTLEVLQNADFRVGRLGPEGVQVLQGLVRDQNEVLEGILTSSANSLEDEGSGSTNLGNITFEPLSVLQAGSLREGQEDAGFNSAPEQAGQNFRVYFTTLGDIVDVIQAHFIETAQQDDRDPIQDIARIITGPYNFQDVYRNEVSINLSNILVDIDSFRKFFTEKVIRSLRVNYNFDDFMKDLFATFGYETNARELIDGNNLLNPKSEINLVKFTKEALSHPIDDSDDVVYTDEMDFRLAAFRQHALGESNAESLIAIPQEEERSPLEQVFRWARQITWSADPEEDDHLHKIPKVYDVEAFFDLSQTGLEEFRATALSPDGNPPKVVNYSFFSANYFNQKIPEGAGTGNNYDYAKHKELDAKRGVFHLNFGERNSIIKNISFEKFDDQPLRTARVFGENSAIENLNFLREIYDVRVQLVGCPFIRPAQFFYLNPLFVGNSSNGATAKDISKFLGIGGYFVALNVTNTIGSDLDYTTNVRLKWVDFGERTDDLTRCPLVPPSLIRSDERGPPILEMEADPVVSEEERRLAAQEEFQDALDEFTGEGDTDEERLSDSRRINRGTLFSVSDPGEGPGWHINPEPGGIVAYKHIITINLVYTETGYSVNFDIDKQSIVGDSRGVVYESTQSPIDEFIEANEDKTNRTMVGIIDDLRSIRETRRAVEEFDE